MLSKSKSYIVITLISLPMLFVAGCEAYNPVLSATPAGITFGSSSDAEIPYVSSLAEQHCVSYGRHARLLPRERKSEVAIFNCVP